SGSRPKRSCPSVSATEGMNKANDLGAEILHGFGMPRSCRNSDQAILINPAASGVNLFALRFGLAGDQGRRLVGNARPCRAKGCVANGPLLQTGSRTPRS